MLPRFEYIGVSNADLPNEARWGSSGYRDQRSNTSPRVAAIYSPSGELAYKLIYANASRISSDAYSFEKINSIEANFLYTTKDTIFTSSLYRYRIDDLLIKVLKFVNGAADEDENQSGRIETFGMEAILNTKLDYNFHSEIAFAYQMPKDLTNPNVDVAYSPRITGKFKLSYENGSNIYSLSARHVGAMLAFFDPTTDNGNSTYGARIGDEAPAYSVVDLNFRANKLLTHGYLDFQIGNLLNAEIRYPNEPYLTRLLDKGTLGAGRSATLVVGWEK